MTLLGQNMPILDLTSFVERPFNRVRPEAVNDRSSSDAWTITAVGGKGYCMELTSLAWSHLASASDLPRRVVR
jgi:hypothetical protein